MIDELNNKYTEFKDVIDVLPTNTKYNRKRKMDYILEERDNDTNRLEIVKKEIEFRIDKFNALMRNNNIKKVEEELEKCNIMSEWNSFNTAYEKMHLDYYLYQLDRYYKEDLVSVNTCIKKILDSFKKVDIVLTKNDFDFNNYASLYMDKIINNVSNDELANYFEDIYWKNPDIIKIIITSDKINEFISKKFDEIITDDTKLHLDGKTREEIKKELIGIMRIDIMNF